MLHLKDDFSLFLAVVGAHWGHSLCSGGYPKGGYLGMEGS